MHLHAGWLADFQQPEVNYRYSTIYLIIKELLPLKRELKENSLSYSKNDVLKVVHSLCIAETMFIYVY
jgi:hypothetical protein